MRGENNHSNSNIENLVIIGSGPAGYTAAIYAARANLSPLVISGYEKGGIPGGQLMTTTFVENYPGFPNGVMGPELMDLIKAQALRWGSNVLEEDALEVDLKQKPFLIKTSTETVKSNALIIATGASANKLGIPNESKYWSKGISACAICDGATPQFKNEDLAVVGGGDSACEEAVYLTKYGSRVHLIVRSKALKASAAMADRVISNTQIKIHWETELINIEGEDWMTDLIIKRANSELTEKIKAKGVFYAIGHTPNTEIFKDQLSLDEKGYIVTKAGRPETSLLGVFAAGDVCDAEWRQGITAAGSGCKAALAAEKWLSNQKLTKFVARTEIEPSKAKKDIECEVSTKDNFTEHVLWHKGSYALKKLYHESKSPVLVVYTSPNCGPCHVLKPQLRKLTNELKGKAYFIEINIEEEEEIAKQGGVTGTPTVQLFQSKKLIKQWKGVKQRSEFKKAINNLL